MTDDNRTIYSLYESNASINHTHSHAGSYTYAPQEYSTVRSEQEENKSKHKITTDLDYCVQKSKSGQKEDYAKILLTLKQIEQNLNNVLK